MVANRPDTSQSKKACIDCGKEFSGEETVCPECGHVLTTLTTEQLIGTVLADRYAIIELIGGGAMGMLYKAKHTLLKRIVAIKMLLPQLVSSAATLKRFQQEAQLASSLNHPNIVTVYDFGLSPQGNPYLVLDYLEGTNLALVLEQEGTLKVPRALRIFEQACAGLSHAHQKGIIHRDLKPSNLMLVTFEGEPDFVKVVDFGIAKLLPQGPEESEHLTETGQIFGSPLYMSPEQCRGASLDPRSDIYALGCVMYRALTGSPPLPAPDLLQCMYRHVNEMPMRFESICPELNLPEALEAIVFKTLDKDADKRYQTMAELKEALEILDNQLTGRPISGTTVFAPALADAGEMEGGSKAPAAEVNASLSWTQADRLSPVHSEAHPVISAKAAGTIKEAESAVSQSGPTTVSQPLPAGQAGTGAASAQNLQEAPTQQFAQAQVAALLKPGILAKPKFLVAAAVLLVVAVATLIGVNYRLLPESVKEKVKEVVPLAPSQSQAQKAAEEHLKRCQAEYAGGNYRQAEQDARAALKEARKLGENDPRRASAHHWLGLSLYAQGSFEEAKSELEPALNRRISAFGKSSAEVADTQAALGRVYSALGQYSQASAMLNASLATRRKVNGAGDLSVADSLSGLADLALRQDKYPDAVSDLVWALDIRQKALGADDPVVATAFNDLGQAYLLSNNTAEAEDLFKKALAIREKKLAGNNPLIAESLSGLGTVCARTGRYPEARSYYTRAIAIQSKALGDASPSVAQTRQLLSQIASKKSQPVRQPRKRKGRPSGYGTFLQQHGIRSY